MTATLLTPQERFAKFTQTKYFPLLDGLRCVSIIAVTWAHSHNSSVSNSLIGALGVDLFFTISGFLITTLLLREQNATGTISLKKFYIRRTLRIFPLYYAVLFLYILLTLKFDRHTPAGTEFFHNLRYYVSYTSNWFVTHDSTRRVIFILAWSLATEEQFYLVWPSVVRLGKIKLVPIAFMVFLLVLGLMARYARNAALIPPNNLVTEICVSIAAPICLGCLLAYGMHSGASYAWLNRFLGHPWSLPIFLALLFVCPALPGVPLLAIQLMMSAVVGASCIRPVPIGSMRNLLGNPVVRYIGMISYGMYLTNMISVNIVRGLSHGSLEKGDRYFALTLVTTLLLATCSYWTYEQWFLRLKTRFSAPQ